MRKVYAHKGFEVVIDVEGVERTSASVVPVAPEGYLATMHIAMAGLPCPMSGPIRLDADRSKPFPTQAEALMAAFSAGQRLVEDRFLP